MSIDSRNTSFDYENDNRVSINNKSLNSTKNSLKDGLSSVELKNKLIQVVKNKGIYDSMKSQLRNKLVLQLNPNLDQIKTKAAEISEYHKTKSNLALNTINCLLINHLKYNEYDYTLSVFMPECGININEVYSLDDILHVLKISPQSKLYNELNNSQAIKSKGLLWYLVNYFCSHYVSNDACTQTDQDGVHNIATNLDLKLKNLDQFYNDKSEAFNNKLSFEDKIVAYQKKLEEKSKLELQQRLNEFKEIELTRMRIEEKEKQRLEMQAYRQDLENTYSKRNEMLNQREKSLEDLLKQKREMEEREIYIQRQHLLDEMKQLREKEAEFKRNVESQTKYLQIDATKYEKLEENLRQRELNLKQGHEDLDVRLRDERERIKLDLERTFAQREFILQSIEAKNKQDATQNEIEKAHLDRLKHEFQLQQIRLNEMDLELQKAQGESICLKQENELMKEKLTHCLDYDFILQENRMLKHKLELSKEIIGEKHLSSRRSNYSARNSVLNNYQPQRKRSVTFASENNEQQQQLQQSESNFDHNKQIPILNLRNSVDDTEMAAEQLPKDDYNDDDLKSRLSMIEEGERILEDAVERSELKEKLEHHSVINEELRDLYEMQIYEQRKLYETISEVKKQVDFIQYGIKTDDELIGKNKTKTSYLLDDVSNTSLGFIDTAKDRLKYLENESERIEQTYRDYQHKIKSKYYPINDDDDNELRIVSKPKKELNQQLDIEKFFETTLKASLNAKLIREELENEVDKYKKEKEEFKKKNPDFRKIDEYLKQVPLSSNLDPVTFREKLIFEENELKSFQNKYRSSLLEDANTNLESKKDINLIKTTTYLDDDQDSSLINNNNNINNNNQKFNDKLIIKKSSFDYDDDKTLDSESKTTNENIKIDSVNKTANFGLNDYVKMFENKSSNMQNVDKIDGNLNLNESDNESLKNNKYSRIKIEYSSSSSSSKASSSSDDEKNISIGNNKKSMKKEQEADDDEDDFNW